jgi:hypothetical protein
MAIFNADFGIKSLLLPAEFKQSKNSIICESMRLVILLRMPAKILNYFWAY